MFYYLLKFYHLRFRAYKLELILKNYKNDKNILKAKKHLSYRLETALVKARKAQYKGGYIKFLRNLES